MRPLRPSLDAFLIVLRSGVSAAHELEETLRLSDYSNTWMQANWESLVEAAIDDSGKVRLQPYGDGADCNAPSSRVFDSAASPTHEIRCRPLYDAPMADALARKAVTLPKEGAFFDRFVSMVSGWYSSSAPPLDFALCELNGREIALSIAELEFLVVETHRP